MQSLNKADQSGNANGQPRQRTWVLLDEVRELGRLDGLPSLLLRGRSRGVCVALGFQDIEGLREVYGDKVANELTGQCNNKAFFRLNSRATAEWAADLIGEEERQEYLKSKTTGGREGPTNTTAEHRNKRHAVMPDELLDLPPTNENNGLTGYYLSAHYGVFRATTSGADLFDNQLWKRPTNVRKVDDFQPRPEDEQYLAPWTDEDLKRLRFDATMTKPAGPSIFDIPRLRASTERSTRRKADTR